MPVNQRSLPEHLRILIVDDQIEARFPLAVVLQLHQAHVIEASSVREALQVLKSNPVDVLLSDIEMPHEDGYALMHQVKTLFPRSQRRPAAIAMTGLAVEESRQRALAAGFQAYLGKPFEVSELLMTVSALLNHSGESDWGNKHVSRSTHLCGTRV